MECGVVGNVSSRILELSKQSENEKRLPVRPKQIHRMVRQTSRKNPRNETGRPNPKTRGEPC